MPAPRIFVSSTCYDLMEIRNNLRKFIQEFSYEPIMSEYGDIFYDFKNHIQDSCIKEIEKSQMFILIVGKNYGSIYHNEKNTKKHPDSVTLKEFKKSIDINIPKMIFIDRFVYYDYRNYFNALKTELVNQINNPDLKEMEPSEGFNFVRDNFDSNYHFPNEAYKYIFRFIDILTGLGKNNAIYEFETIDDIQEMLKKQWAGFLYDKLAEEKKIGKMKDEKATLKEINGKLDFLESFIKEISTNKESNTLSISIPEIENTIKYDNLKKAQTLLSNTLFEILYYWEEFNEEPSKKFTIDKNITENEIEKWLEGLENTIKIYKWTKGISLTELFNTFPITIKLDSYIDLENIITLSNLYKSIPKNEKKNFIFAVFKEFQSLIVEIPF